MVEIDPAALRRLYDDLGEKILVADRGFRAAHTGAQAEYLAPKARELFEGIGVHLTEAQLDEYADSVADDRPFEFVLN